jgi:RsiW-degrading membrane proteinase PrsW (M82 family)
MSIVPAIMVVCLSVAAGILPTAVYVLAVWWIDRYEKEPVKLLAAALLWGAIPAGILSLVIEGLSQGPVAAATREYSQLVGTSLVAPIVEECVKGLALLGLFWLARSDFDDVLDGIVYGSIVGFGFAMSENILYYLRSWAQGGVAPWTIVVLGRSIPFGLNHAIFTSLTGVGFGLARYERSFGRRALFVALGLIAAVTAHFAHNFWLAAGGFCVLSFLADWLGVLVVLSIVVLAWRREAAWMATELPEEVSSGVLTPLQFETISSRRERLRQGWRVLGISGLHQARLWRRLVDTSTELAFKKHQRALLGKEKGNDAAIVRLRAAVLAIRQDLGDEAAARSRICSTCGELSARDMVATCPHCGSAWPESEG